MVHSMLPLQFLPLCSTPTTSTTVAGAVNGLLASTLERKLKLLYSPFHLFVPLTELKGHLRVNVHYYEDGNVQLNTNTVKRTAVRASNPAQLADEAVKAISKLEHEFHTSLESSYDMMNETTFKALRRALPMTHTKVQWSKISQYKLGQELGK